MTFASFGFPPRIASNIEALGYVSPTPIQEQAIPPVMQGRDVMGLAQTGTGKTAAFLLPILNRLLASPAGPRPRVRALVIAPTRELAEQIFDAALDLGKQTRIRCATIYGGVGINPQIRKLRDGVDIVVACPGRLLDHLGQGTVDLSAVETLVLDEADHMFDMGFLPTIRRILARLPAKRQTLLFSATMPEDIRRLAADILRDPVTVRIGRQAPVETVSHAAYPVPAHLKTSLLLALLKRAEEGSVLVFTRTKHRAKRLAEHLLRAGHNATCLQGNLSQNRRQAALDGFRDGRFKVLVATDIAARGIDVTRIAHVINYDIPDTPEAYTHRIGRTGRAEKTGEAHTLITFEDAPMVRAIESLLREPLPRRTLEGFDYAASAPERDSVLSRPAVTDRSGGYRSERGSQSRSDRGSQSRSDRGSHSRFEHSRSGRSGSSSRSSASAGR